MPRHSAFSSDGGGSGGVGGRSKAVKVAACEAVKALLGPLYSRQLLGKEAFKEAARAATEALCEEAAEWGLGADELRWEGGLSTGEGRARALAALARALEGAGLGALVCEVR